MRAARDWAVPASFADGRPAAGRHPPGHLRELALSAPDRRAAERSAGIRCTSSRRSGSTARRFPVRRRSSCTRAASSATCSDVAIVAHSKGGLVGKHVMALDDRDGRVDRLVAIASPFNGSAMARLAPNPALRAFLPDDPVIAALARGARRQRAHHVDLSELRPAHPRGLRARGRRQHRGPGGRALPHPARSRR